jgi:hypothetical protein
LVPLGGACQLTRPKALPEALAQEGFDAARDAHGIEHMPPAEVVLDFLRQLRYDNDERELVISQREARLFALHYDSLVAAARAPEPKVLMDPPLPCDAETARAWVQAMAKRLYPSLN